MDLSSFQWSYEAGASATGLDASAYESLATINDNDLSRAMVLSDAFPHSSGDAVIDAMVWSAVPRWTDEAPNDGNVVYYTFLTEPLLYSHYGDPVENFSTFTDAQKTAVVEIFEEASSLTGLTFVETSNTSQADIFFGNSDLVYENYVGMTYSYVDYSTDSSGNVTYLERYDFVFLDNAEFARITQSPEAGNYGYEYLMHEIGHTLGLDDTATTGAVPAEYDNTDYTIMSYNVGSEGPQSDYQELDVSALHFIYSSMSRGLVASTDTPSLTASGASSTALFAQA